MNEYQKIPGMGNLIKKILNLFHVQRELRLRVGPERAALDVAAVRSNVLEKSVVKLASKTNLSEKGLKT